MAHLSTWLLRYIYQIRRKWTLIFLLLSAITVSIMGCNNTPASTENQITQEKNNWPSKSETGIVSTQTNIPPSSPITIKLYMAEAPPLNVPAEMTCTLKLASGFAAVENVTAQINLPPAASLVSGNLTWSGNLEPGKPVSFPLVIVFNIIGHWTIEATISHVIDDNNGWGDLDALFLDIGVEHSQFGWTPEPVRVTTAPP